MDFSILVIDDQPENIKYVSILLKEMGLGKKIYSAPNGKVALELMESVIPNLILSDWGMPEMDGLELLKRLKSSERTKDIPFIMISAVKVDAPSMKESFDAGVHDYLRKPFDKLEFMARVSATLKLHDAYITIKKSKDEIANQAQLISKQHQELQKLDKLKDKIFSIISHDIRAPLATLDGLLHIFGDEEIELGENELKEYANVVKLELNSVQSLMDNLLFWAKSQLGNKKNNKEKIDLHEIAQENHALFAQKMIKKNLDFYNHIHFGSYAEVDKNIVSFVIRNLFANAIKFTPEGGRITTDCEITSEALKVSVLDTGIGMSEETISVLFDDKTVYTKEGTSGELCTGLGLMLCKELIEQNGGVLSVRSELGGGSIFRFELPL